MSLSKGPHVSEQGSPCLSARATPRPQSGLSIYREQLSGSGMASVVLCPRLRHLQIESEVLWMGPDLIPFAKDIITLRAECGSPLKVFTFFEFAPKPGRKVDLIGRDGSFTMEKCVPVEEAEKFILDI